MKIVIDARESGTSTGRYVDKLIEHMHTLETPHEMVILTKKNRMDFMSQVAPDFTAIETPYKEFSIGEQLGFMKQIRSLEPDLVHFAIVQQPVLYRGKTITTMHDLTTVRFRNPTKNYIVFTIKQTVYKWVNKRVARKSSLVLTPTEYVKEDVVSYTKIKPGKVRVTYEAADAIKAPATPIKTLVNKQFIMYIGRPTPHKNLRRLIDAFAILQKDFPALYLVLAGKKDSLYEAHAKYAMEKGIKNIIFTGFISDGELRWLYENTACYVFPSLSEGFGLPGLEAMAHGAPVASSNATCLPEVYGDAAIYFDPGDSGAVAGAVMTVLSDKKIADTLRKKGFDQVNKYSWQHMAKQTFDAYEEILKI